MTSLPLAVRVAAGLAAATVERARKLPKDLTELPMTAVSQAMQVSMRVQQRITDLAIRGDNAIAWLRPLPEQPSWAVFDEDTDPSGVYQRSEDSTGEDLATTTSLPTDWYDADYGLDDASSDHAAERIDEPTHEPADEPAHEPADAPAGPAAAGWPAADRTDELPAALPTYPELSLPSVRARLRGLSVADLEVLLDYELATADRPDFVRMLTNRIHRLRAEPAGQTGQPDPVRSR